MKREIKKSIAHYDRMITWVRGMSKKDRLDFAWEMDMKEAIGESWGAGNCALCEKFSNLDCDGCPYYKKYGVCTTRRGVKNAWGQLIWSETWGDWLKAANKVRRQLASLP